MATPITKEEEKFFDNVGNRIQDRFRAEGFEKLSPVEQTVFSVLVVWDEVYKGGFQQFYHNSSGDAAGSVPQALKEIGASRLADIAQRANDVFARHAGKSFPIHRDDRIAACETMSEGVDGTLDKLTDEFHEDIDSIRDFYIDWLRAHQKTSLAETVTH